MFVVRLDLGLDVFGSSIRLAAWLSSVAATTVISLVYSCDYRGLRLALGLGRVLAH